MKKSKSLINRKIDRDIWFYISYFSLLLFTIPVGLFLLYLNWQITQYNLNTLSIFVMICIAVYLIASFMIVLLNICLDSLSSQKLKSIEALYSQSTKLNRRVGGNFFTLLLPIPVFLIAILVSSSLFFSLVIYNICCLLLYVRDIRIKWRFLKEEVVVDTSRLEEDDDEGDDIENYYHQNLVFENKRGELK